jgi:formate hydrogenlyase subunit 6/NADH:ubiquinone oxidoreductase subunit I
MAFLRGFNMSVNFVKIEASECKGCRVCVEACPKGCISIGSAINNIGYQYAKFENKGCIACGLCFYVCPELGAITVYKGEKEEIK